MIHCIGACALCYGVWCAAPLSGNAVIGYKGKFFREIAKYFYGMAKQKIKKCDFVCAIVFMLKSDIADISFRVAEAYERCLVWFGGGGIGTRCVSRPCNYSNLPDF